MNPQRNTVRTHLDALISVEVPENYGLATGNGVAAGKFPIGHARLQDFRASHSHNAQHVHGVGDYNPADTVNLKFSGRLTLDTFMIRKRDLVALGIAPLGAAVLKAGMLVFTITDPETGLTLREYIGCVIDTYEENIRQGEIAGENAVLLFQDVRADTSVYDEITGTDPSNQATFEASATQQALTAETLGNTVPL